MTPREVLEQVQRLAAEREAITARIDAWNRQIEDAVDVIRAAAENGNGVIVSYSYEANTIEAVERDTVARGVAYVFNRDATAPTPHAVRLAEGFLSPGFDRTAFLAPVIAGRGPLGPTPAAS